MRYLRKYLIIFYRIPIVFYQIPTIFFKIHTVLCRIPALAIDFIIDNRQNDSFHRQNTSLLYSLKIILQRGIFLGNFAEK